MLSAGILPIELTYEARERATLDGRIGAEVEVKDEGKVRNLQFILHSKQLPAPSKACCYNGIGDITTTNNDNNNCSSQNGEH